MDHQHPRMLCVIRRSAGLRLAIGIVLALWLCPNPAWAQGAPKEYRQSFQGTARPADWGYYGTGAAGFVKFEDPGLHFVVPAGFDGPRPQAGLATRVALKGDFDITLDYEFLQDLDPMDAGKDGTRLTVDVVLDTPGRDVATLSRRIAPLPGGHRFFAWMRTNDAGKINPRGKGFPATAKSGKLRMVRAGAMLTYFAAEGDAKEFKPLIAYPFGVADTYEIRILGQTGGAKAALEARVTNLHVRADAIVKPPTAPTAAAPRLLVLTPPAPKAYAEEYAQSFKGTVRPAGWELEGPFAEGCVQFEPAGLHINLPAGWDGERPGTGLKSEVGVTGDFEITIGFEILAEPAQAAAGKSGTRLSLAVYKKSKKGDVATINRSTSARGENVFMAWARVWNEATDKPQIPMASFPTKARTGRLRLVREGPHLFYGLAEGLDGEVRFRAKFLFGAEDLRDVRIVGSTGGEDSALDVRVTDFRIRADGVSNLPANPLAAAADAKIPAADAVVPVPAGPPRKAWLIAALGVGLAITLLVAVGVGVWLLRRQRNQAVAAVTRSPR